MATVDALEKEIHNVTNEVNSEKTENIDFSPIKQRVNNLTQKCALLKKCVKEQHTSQEQLLEDIEAFLDTIGELHAFVDKTYDTLEKLEPIHNDAEVLDKQLEEVEV